MPSGVRSLRVRTDALELEVLGIRPTDDHSGDDNENDRHGATQSASTTTTTADVMLTTDGLSETEPARRTRWFHFGHKSRRRRRRWQRHKEEEQQLDDNSDDCLSGTKADAHETVRHNCNIESTTLANSNNSATLAQPETTTIANSTHTIATPLLLSPDNDDEQETLTPHLPPLRSNSLANASLSIDSPCNSANLSIRQSEPNVAAAAAKSNACQRPTILYLDTHAVTLTFDKTRTSAPASSSYPPDLHLTAQTATRTTLLDESKKTATEALASTASATPNTGLRASFMSMLSSLAIWKDSNCWRQSQQQQERRQSHRRRRSRHSQATTLDSSELFGQNDTYACEEPLNAPLPPAAAKGKRCNISGDFEQIATSTSALTTGKSQNNFRRLSQVRRRRSSYYFSENERRIRANDKEFNAQFKYHNNYIKTSKYTLFTFLPFNLLEQFQRLANFYFLCLLVLQLIPAISSLTPVTTAIPLIGVLTLTAVKDAYDDIQRHISDSQVNNRKSKSLRNGKLVDSKWSEVQVGDVIRLDNNQFVAADILLLTTSEPNGLCFIETAELDGETNLKCKQCLPETIELGQQHDELWNFNGEIICERPNNLLNKFDGTLIWRNQRYALDNEKILLRGCVLRNTQWCYGVVVFAGVDTKLMQNSGKTQFKSTGVDRLLNFIIIGIVLFLVSICAFFAIACGIWEGMIGQYFQVYLPWENIVPKDVTIGSTVIGLLVFFSYAIVLNTVVPISLYVSVEVIRFVQSFLINWDEEMYDSRTNTYAKARTTTLNEELGQIQYIFSDKTGTLTQNIMTFNKCSINGRSYGDVIDLRTGEPIEITDKQTVFQNNNNKSTTHKQTTTTTTVVSATDEPSATKSMVMTAKATATTTTPTPPPTILVHSAEVHTMKSTVIVDASGTTELLTAEKLKGNVAETLLGNSNNNCTNENLLNLPQTTKKRSNHVHYVESLELPELAGANTGGSLGRRGRMRRQLSTASTASTASNDKVNILNELSMKTFKKIENKSNKNNNNNSAMSNNNKKLPVKSNFTTTTTIAPTTTTITITTDEQDSLPSLSSSSSTSSLLSSSSSSSSTSSLVSLTSRSSSMSYIFDDTNSVKQLIATTTTTTPKTKTKSKNLMKIENNKSTKPKHAEGQVQSSKLQSMPYQYHSVCSSNNITTDNPTAITTVAVASTDSNNKNKNKHRTKQEPKETNQTCTQTNNNKSNITHTNASPPNQNALNNVKRYLNTHNFATNNWSAARQKVHALEPVDFSKNPHHEPEFRWYDRTLLEAVRSDEEHAQNFFRLLALCHTVMAEIVDGKLEYQAQSPDESALVSAARNFGFVFLTRTPNSITIEVMGQTEQYELLHILDFNNVRKRMSVVLRRDNTVLLYCKGADNVIYDRLHSGQESLKARTQDHLNKFAGEGLRTLVLAERRISEEFYNNWRERQQEAALSMDQREQKLNAIYEEIESEMSLVGVTAIEDKLQDGVPKSIANLQNAGIKIWVLTGDKQETAINIGYSCQLLTDELADVFIVDGNSVEEVEKQLRQFKESIKILNRFRPGGLEANNQNNLSMDPLNEAMTHTSAYMNETNVVQQPQPTQPPAISVVTFRWDAKIKDNKGGPDSAECDELSQDAEKGGGENNTASDLIVDESTGFALVVNGHSLVHCLTPELETRFLEIASQCKAVICCRVTPLQKALVVELIKRAKNAVTLAIGDGANDVSMIKAAHIGVGISGQEGLQAVLASDYSIAQFRFLERLLLVHGRWSYYRMCKFLRYFFYKNFAFTLCHCWYSLFCGFSAQTVFDPMFISVYNLFYTSLPVLALGVFEQDVSDKNSIDYPRLYTPGLKSELFNLREFIYSVLHGAFTSLILFLIPYGTYIDGIAANGQILSDHMTLGAVVATILIVDNTAQVSLYTSYWTIVNHITIWGSLVWYFVLDYFYNYVIGGPYVGALTQAIKDLTFWVTMLLTVTVLMAPVLAYKFYLLDVNPSLSDKIRKKLLQANARLSSDVKRTPSARRGRRSVRSGYAFAHQEGFGRLITSGKIMHKMPQDLAFPLGLGSKKTQALHNETNSAGSDHPKNQQGQHNNNNVSNLRHTQNHTSMADLRAETNENGIHSTQNGELSPRAPCQDLDTINL